MVLPLLVLVRALVQLGTGGVEASSGSRLDRHGLDNSIPVPLHLVKQEIYEDGQMLG